MPQNTVQEPRGRTRTIFTISRTPDNENAPELILGRFWGDQLYGIIT